jgi:hypothetical protein
MPSEKIKNGLTLGLLANFGGNTTPETVNRSGFDLKSCSLSKDGVTYTDQWLPRDSGGGQELVRADKEEFTRLYAGGIVGPEKLEKLGITGKEVIGHLIQRISSLGPKTRLFADCQPDNIGLWGYGYKIIEQEPEVGVLAAKETITYKNQLVFVHYFLLSEVSQT